MIYNLRGQEVYRLEQTVNAGWYTYTWTGRDYLGKEVASGVYLYRFQVNDFSQTYKMLLLK